MTTRARQGIVLSVLALVLAVVVWLRLAPLVIGGAGGGSSATSGSSAAARGDSGWADELPEVEELQLSVLESSADKYSPDRDPFRYKEATKKDAAKDSRDALQEALRKARAKQAPPAAPPPQPAAPQPPPVDVVFLGSFGPEQQRLAVFSDGSEIYNVPEGDVLKNKFVVVRIGYESADLGFVGFPDAPARRLEIGG